MKVLIYFNAIVSVLFLSLSIMKADILIFTPVVLTITFLMFTTLIQIIIGIAISIQKKYIHNILWRGILIGILFVLSIMILGPSFGKQ